MEKEKANRDSLEEYFRREIRPIFEGVAKETHHTPVRGGGGVGDEAPHFFYRPHNYRRWIDFCKDSFNPKAFKVPTSIRNEGPGSFVSGGYINNGHEWLGEFIGFKIRIKRYQIEIQNRIEPGKVFRLPVSEGGCHSVLSIVEKKEKETLDFLKSFISIGGGSSDFHILKRKQEEKVTHEDSISMIPRNQVFHTPLFKNVYEVPAVEFYDTISTVNFISNRSIENISPMISGAMNLLSQYIETLNPLKALKRSVSCIDDVIKNKHLVKILSPWETHNFEDWLFSQFGIKGECGKMAHTNLY